MLTKKNICCIPLIILLINSIAFDVFGKIYEPLIETNWHQNSPFDKVLPYDPRHINYSGDYYIKSDVGCLATAMAQIINYWEYPKSIQFNNQDKYISRRFSPWVTISINDDHALYSFADFYEDKKDMPSLNTYLANITYDLESQPDYRAYLSFAVGIKTKMNYSADGTGAIFLSANRYLDKFSFGSARTVFNLPGTNFYERLRENIRKHQPVQLQITSQILGGKAHSVIVDGYNDVTGEYHLNNGWWIESEGWYSLPDGPQDYKHVTYAIMDIMPFQGWHQYGANERNSFYTPYSAPTAEKTPITPKWQVTSPSTHTFKGLVIGTGNKIYASLAPNALNQGNHPGVWIINQYGEVRVEEKYYITAENEGISYPVQNSKGDVFVAGGEGGVYRIDTKAKAVVKTFQDTSGGEIDTPKIDSEDYIYINTDDKLYRLKADGSPDWTFTPPHGGKMYRGKPAIDVSRNNVYIGYYDSVNDIAYLGCVNRATGMLKYEESYSTAYSSRMTGIASVAEDGTVYVGFWNQFKALTPGSSSFSEKWNVNTNSKISSAPVIGKDGTIYLAYWHQSGSNWYYRFNAFEPVNGNPKWSSPIDLPSMGDYDNVLQPYATSNGIIVFSIRREQPGPDTFEMYAYRDEGNHATELWHEDWGFDSGADVTFGPGGTLYVLPSGAGGTIYAISDGEVGDAESGGMAYTDNRRPNMPVIVSPADGSENLDTSVTLSWLCNDPEDHSIKYALFVGESGYDMVPVATNLATNTYQLTGLESATSYRWMIVATDGQAVSEGPTWVFATEPSPELSITPDSQSGGGGCFIATAAFGSYMEPSVMILREFRDGFLLTNSIGEAFVEQYYKYSPPLANIIANHGILKTVVRLGLLPLVGLSWAVLNYGFLLTMTAMLIIISGMLFSYTHRKKLIRILLN